MSNVDLSHLHYPPTAVEELTGDIGSLVDQMLGLRRELIELERIAYQTAADIDNNTKQLAADRALLGLTPQTALEAQRDGNDSAYLKASTAPDALAKAFAEQASGLRESAKAQIGQIQPTINAQSDKVGARDAYWNGLRLITTDDSSDLAFSKRRERLLSVFLDCIEELYQKAFSLQVGITKILANNSAPNDPDFRRVRDQFPNYKSPDVIEKMVLWARAAGRFVERRSFERITTTAVIPLLQLGMWGNALINDASDWEKDAAFDANFTIERDKHLPSNGDPRIVGIGIQIGQNQMSDSSGSQLKINETVRSSVELTLPKTTTDITAPFDENLTFSWTCQPSFTMYSIGVFDVDAPALSHPSYRNLSPFGEWRIKLPRFVVSKGRPSSQQPGSAYLRKDYANDIKIILRLSTLISV
jgi:hypothetical protein